MQNKYTLIPLIGIFCCNANAASPVLINGDFDAFSISTGPYVNAYNALTNPDGYNTTFGNTLGAYAGNYFTTTTGIGWQTSINSPLEDIPANKVVEIWQSGFQNISSTTGTGQYAEMNANAAGTLYQDVTIALLGNVDYSFSHLNRDPGTDTMKVLITYLGADGILGGVGDQVVADQTYSTTNAVGVRVWSEFAVDNAFESIPGGTYRFSFGAVNVGSQGNFLDNVRFGIDVVPEPSSALLGAFGALALLRRRRH